MSQLIFLTFAILGPIPLAHFTLHFGLKFWRRFPRSFYLAGVGIVLVMLALGRWAQTSQAQFFTPSADFVVIIQIVATAALLLLIWSIIELNPKRFFLWAVVKPDAIEQKQIWAGPYRFFRHPGYTAYLTSAFCAFMASGYKILFYFFAVAVLAMLIIVKLEEREMGERFSK